MKCEALCDACVTTDCKNSCPHKVVREAPQDVSPLDDMVSQLRSLVVKRAILDAMATIEDKIAKHESGEYPLIDEALNDYLHDRKILRKLGAG